MACLWPAIHSLEFDGVVITTSTCSTPRALCIAIDIHQLYKTRIVGMCLQLSRMTHFIRGLHTDLVRLQVALRISMSWS
jgi:hypothetical protein